MIIIIPISEFVNRKCSEIGILFKCTICEVLFVAFYDIFKQECVKSGISPTALLKELHISTSKLTAWKNGSMPNSEYLIPISEKLSVSIDYLLTGKEKSPSAEQTAKEQVLSKEEKELLGYFSVLPRDVRQKLLGRAELLAEQASEQPEDQQEPIVMLRHSLYMVSAGTGFDLDEGDSWDEVPVPDTPESRKADFCVTVSGDSMEPRFSGGDTVLVKTAPSVDKGQICIYRIESKGYIKKFEGDRLVSLNPKYDDIMLCNYDIDSIACVGLVVGKV